VSYKKVTSGVVLLVVGVLGLTLLTACGGGEDSQSDRQPSPAATPAPGALPTVDPDAPLAEYESPDKGYTVGYPEGWEIAEGPGPVISFRRWTPEGQVAAQLTIACWEIQEGWTIETLMTQDATAAVREGGFQTTPGADIEVAGVAAKKRRYSLNVAGLEIEHVVAYFIQGDCGWRIGLNSYGKNTLDPYVPLFDRILDSFRLR
jgi:hypothetical protein